MCPSKVSRRSAPCTLGAIQPVKAHTLSTVWQPLPRALTTGCRLGSELASLAVRRMPAASLFFSRVRVETLPHVDSSGSCSCNGLVFPCTPISTSPVSRSRMVPSGRAPNLSSKMHPSPCSVHGVEGTTYNCRPSLRATCAAFRAPLLTGACTRTVARESATMSAFRAKKWFAMGLQ